MKIIKNVFCSSPEKFSSFTGGGEVPFPAEHSTRGLTVEVMHSSLFKFLGSPSASNALCYRSGRYRIADIKADIIMTVIQSLLYCDIFPDGLVIGKLFERLLNFKIANDRQFNYPNCV